MAETSGGSIDVLVEETEDVSVNQAPGSKFDYIFFLKMKAWLWNSTFVWKRCFKAFQWHRIIDCRIVVLKLRPQILKMNVLNLHGIINCIILQELVHWESSKYFWWVVLDVAGPNLKWKGSIW